MYYKNHDRRKFYSTFCQTAKQIQHYNFIQSTQNDSTSIEHNSKTLAQNKFNTRPKFYFLSKHFLLYAYLSSAFSFSSVFLPLHLAFIQIKVTCREILANARGRPFSTSLGKALLLESDSIYANILHGAWTKTYHVITVRLCKK